MVMSLLESLYKSLYKNVKDSALSIFRSPWRPEKSCVFAATALGALDPIVVSWRARHRYPLSCSYRTEFRRFLFGSRKINFPQIYPAPLFSMSPLKQNVINRRQSVKWADLRGKRHVPRTPSPSAQRA